MHSLSGIAALALLPNLQQVSIGVTRDGPSIFPPRVRVDYFP